MNLTTVSAIYAAATFLSTLLGGYFALRYSGWMDRIMAFSGGMLLAAGLLDLLPESIALGARGPAGITARSVYPPLLWVVGGFVLFYLVERMAILRSYHSHHPHPEQTHRPDPLTGGPATVSPGHDGHSDSASRRQVGILGAAGLCIHSLLDGFSIGIAFHASHSLGVLVGAAIIAHDFSDGVTTVTMLLSNRNSRGASHFWLLLDALAPLLGLLLAAVLPLSIDSLSGLLGGFAGMFLYLGATHLLPEAHALSDSWVTVAWMLLGVGLVIGITQILA